MKRQVPKIWNGDCWIIAGGNSVAELFGVPDSIVPESHDEFRDFGRFLKPIHDSHVIGVNLAAFLGDWVDVAYWGDQDTYVEYQTWWNGFGGLKVTSCSVFADPKAYPDLVYIKKKKMVGISTTPEEITWAGKNTGASAINLATLLGCQRVFLLGMDMRSRPDGRIHWHAGYPDKLQSRTLHEIKKGVPPVRSRKQPFYNRFLEGLKVVAADCAKLGIEVYNVTNGSRLDLFPTVSLAEAFKIAGITDKAKGVPVPMTKSNKYLCVCGRVKGKVSVINGVKSITCPCGIVRQKLTPSEIESIEEYYSKEYHAGGIYTHSYEDDYNTAKLRMKEYKKHGLLNKDDVMLDIGAGNGAFLDLLLKNGFRNSYGTEVHNLENERVYCQHLDKVHFPTDHFDNVFLHDVLEHVLDPISFLKEVIRVTRELGRIIIEIPAFWHKEGKRHWKQLEHLWMFSYEQLSCVLSELGVNIDYHYNPVNHKQVVIASKPRQNRTKILVPPGIGDIHWVIVKLQSFIKEHKIQGQPEVWIASFDSAKDRAIDYLKMIPFIKAAGYKYVSKADIPWKEAYADENGRTVYRNVAGCDYFIAFNGQLRGPKMLDHINPEYPCNYDVPMFESIEQKEYTKLVKKTFGKYVVAYFIDHGMYRKWVDDFSADKIISVLNGIQRNTGYKIVFVGSFWDSTPFIQKIKKNVKNIVDLVGKTSIEDVFGLIKGAEGVIGYPSGITIMSTFFKVRTYIFWNEYFNYVFWRAACHPSTFNDTYFAADTKACTVTKVLSEFTELLGFEKRYIICVLKSGGDYTPEYVYNLRAMLYRNVSVSFKFKCFTDMDLDLPEDEIIPLTENWPGWWSKVEIFKNGNFPLDARITYFDLDTVIIKNIDRLIDDNVPFRMLEGFHPSRPCASGVMSFTGDHQYIFEAMKKNSEDIMEKYKGFKNNGAPMGDQAFISSTYIGRNQKRPAPIQRVMGVCSFKRHIMKRKRPTTELDCPPVICFHGQPRPHMVDLPIIKKHWRN